MPLYEYRCKNCGHQFDIQQSFADDSLTVCPNCGQPSYVKQVTAAGFQLKGSGWYATDFKGGSTAAPAAADGEKKADGAKTGTSTAEGAKPAEAPAKPADTGSSTAKPDTPSA